MYEGRVRLQGQPLEEANPRRVIEAVAGSSKTSFGEVGLSYDEHSMEVTPGKINLSMDDGTEERALPVLDRIADVDVNAYHETSLEERYENIEDYEKDGYVLASYAKVEGGVYRIVFQVPFHSEQALRRFAGELPDGGFDRPIFWEGNDAKIAKLVDVFVDEGWSLKEVVLEVEDEILAGKIKGAEPKERFDMILD